METVDQGSALSGRSVEVGLDFGITFSGYAYCHKDDPGKIFMFYEWPEQARGGGQPYCKTQTSLLYASDAEGNLQLKSWGWPASVEYQKAMSPAAKSSHDSDPHKLGHLVKLFKLTLAPQAQHSSCSSRKCKSLPAEHPHLPPGLTTRIVIKDYLREISKSIMRGLKNRYGA